MSDFSKISNYPIITGKPSLEASKQTLKAAQGTGLSFQELLNERLKTTAPPPQLTFSKHAQARTVQRGIEMTPTDYARLDEATQKAEDKGLTDTLVFMNNTAFIVNVPSRVVITVVDGSENTVFTNIDGAVIV